MNGKGNLDPLGGLLSIKQTLLGALVLSIATLGLAQAPAPATPRPPAKPGLTLTTTAFEDGGIIPIKYSFYATPAAAVSPALQWTHVPDRTV